MKQEVIVVSAVAERKMIDDLLANREGFISAMCYNVAEEISLLHFEYKSSLIPKKQFKGILKQITKDYYLNVRNWTQRGKWEA